MQLALFAFRLERRGREVAGRVGARVCQRGAAGPCRGGQGRNDGLADWVGDAAERGFGDAAEVRGDGLAASVARGGGWVRGDGLAACVGDAAERGFGDAAEVRGDGLAASVGDAAGRGAGPWRGGELGYRRSGREAVSSCLREIHLEPAIIDYQAVNSRKGCR